MPKKIISLDGPVGLGPRAKNTFLKWLKSTLKLLFKINLMDFRLNYKLSSFFLVHLFLFASNYLFSFNMQGVQLRKSRQFIQGLVTNFSNVMNYGLITFTFFRTMCQIGLCDIWLYYIVVQTFHLIRLVHCCYSNGTLYFPFVHYYITSTFTGKYFW